MGVTIGVPEESVSRPWKESWRVGRVGVVG